MKKILAVALLLGGLVGCKKSEVQAGGDCDTPPGFLFQLADRTGRLLATSPADELTVTYVAADNMRHTAGPYIPKQLPGSSSQEYYYADEVMAGKTVQGIQTFYLNFKGQTDTLSLQSQNKCGYNSLATFDGRAMPRVAGTGSIPDYYVFRRR